MGHSRSCCILHPCLEFWNVSCCPPVELRNLFTGYFNLLQVTLIWCAFSGICRYFKNSTGNLPILNQPVCTIPLGSWVPRIGDPNGRPLAMLRRTASLSSALNMLIQGMSCVHLPGATDDNREMQRSLCWGSSLHFPWQLLFAEVPHRFHWKLDIIWRLYCVAKLILYACRVIVGCSWSQLNTNCGW
jgi:hypothetical protein